MFSGISYKDTKSFKSGPHYMTSLNVSYFSRVPALNRVTFRLGIQGFNM